jgi:hypothetical protein
MNKKRVLFFILIFFILIGILHIVFFYTMGLFFWEKRNLPEVEVENVNPYLLKEFSGGPVVTGEFLEIDTERNLLSIQTYDPDLREDIIFTVKITDNTIFAKKTAPDNKEELYTKEKFYLDVLPNVNRGTYFSVTVDDIGKKPPEAFLVRVVDLNSFKNIPSEPETL